MAAFKKAIEQYEGNHPNVKVQLELVSADNLIPYYATNLAGGNTPDIGVTWDSLTIEYVTKDYALPLDDIVNDMGGIDEFVKYSLFNKDGHIYNMPYAGGGPVLWIRKDLFEKYNIKIPETWDEWLDAAKKLTLDTNNDGSIDIYGTTIAAGKNNMTEAILFVLIWQTGHTAFDADMKPTFNNEGTIKALQFLKNLAKYCPPGIGEYSYYEMIDALSSKRVASTIYWGRVLGHLKDNAPDLLDKIQAVPLPTDKIKVTYSSHDDYLVFKNSKYPEIAKDFLKFIVTGDRMADFLLTVPGHLLPVTKANTKLESFWNDPFVKQQKKNIEVLFEVPNYGISMANEAGAKIVNGKFVPLEGMFNSVYAKVEAQYIVPQAVQKVIIQGMSPEDTAKWGQAEMERIISELK
ncbi:MAG: sugar ABC transporter substrate-binding protein [Spirochaetota bacterium]